MKISLVTIAVPCLWIASLFTVVGCAADASPDDSVEASSELSANTDQQQPAAPAPAAAANEIEEPANPNAVDRSAMFVRAHQLAPNAPRPPVEDLENLSPTKKNP